MRAEIKLLEIKRYNRIHICAERTSKNDSMLDIKLQNKREEERDCNDTKDRGEKRRGERNARRYEAGK